MKRFIVIAFVAFMSFSGMTIAERFPQKTFKDYVLNKSMTVYLIDTELSISGTCVAYTDSFIVLQQSNQNAIIPVHRIKLIYSMQDYYQEGGQK